MCRGLSEESDGEYFRDSSSDGSSDSEHDRSGSNNLRTSSISHRVDQFPLREHHTSFQEGFSSDEGESGSSQGCLLYEYFARDQPYSREPLEDKVSYLFHPEILYEIFNWEILIHFLFLTLLYSEIFTDI